MLKNTFVPIIAILLSGHSALAEIYSSEDASGNTIYSDQKPSADAKPSPSSNAVNYYISPKSSQEKRSSKDNQLPDRLDTLTAEDGPVEQAPLTEEQCQQQYSRSCEQVTNWMEFAKEKCGNDSRCDDPDFLDRKYRPRSNDEVREIALRAAIRNNNHDDKIALFLTKKYTNFCENQAVNLCRNKRDRNCEATMQFYCEDPRDLQDIFAKYDNLSAIEKQTIIKKAKALTLANGDNQNNYDEIIANLIEILISQALLGI